MANKRFHYDKKGNLRGYSSNKFHPRMRSVYIIFIVLALVGLLTRKASDNSVTENRSVSINNTQEVQAEIVKSDAQKLADTIAESEVAEEKFREQNPRDKRSAFERDLKPYYEAECAKGDDSACTALKRGE